MSLSNSRRPPDLQREAEAVRALAVHFEGDDLECAISSESNFEEALSAGIEVVAEAENVVDAIEARIRDLRARQERHKHKATQVRDAIVSAMQIAGQKTVRLPTATLTVSTAPPSVVVIDEDAIPAAYWQTVSTRKLLRTAIASDLKAGRAVDGATLENLRDRLTVRTA